MSWKLMRFRDFLTRSKIPINIEDDGLYKRVTIKIKHNGVSLRDEEVGKRIGTKKQFVLKAGQFILSKIDARYGAFGIAPEEVDGAIITGNFWAYDVDFSLVNIEWFNQFTNSQDFYDLCERASSGITHRKYLNEDSFLYNQIYLPSPEEQLEIIEEFNTNKKSINILSTELTHQLDLVKQLRQAFLREAMQGKLVPQDPNDEPASVLLDKIKAEKERLIKEKNPSTGLRTRIKKQKPLPPITEDEIPFEIPNNWVWCRLGELGVCQTGTTPSTQIKEYFGSDIPFIKPADITLKGLIIDNEGLTYLGLKKGVSVLPNSLLMVCIGGSIGKSYYCEQLVSCNQQINTITPHLDIPASFFQFWCQSTYFQESIWSKASGGTTPIVNRTKWESISLPLPPLPEQKRIVAKLDELMQYCDGLEASIKESQQQNEMLLQQVLREALEPASTAERVKESEVAG